ncbi:uncharacterized protein B0T15DRAFT_511296 [Chaetomium strumarium]|uniref:Uncharacterized protein n=1 Tax=Chaetomium strumarium TaxID=1170767 RepID=A0AAJ0M1D0_9PEZI|nr:hypothetical protein B0T15DRAFT_511296 [Chaetomium strumarium]
MAIPRDSRNGDDESMNTDLAPPSVGPISFPLIVNEPSPQEGGPAETVDNGAGSNNGHGEDPNPNGDVSADAPENKSSKDKRREKKKELKKQKRREKRREKRNDKQGDSPDSVQLEAEDLPSQQETNEDGEPDDAPPDEPKRHSQGPRAELKKRVKDYFKAMLDGQRNAELSEGSITARAREKAPQPPETISPRGPAALCANSPMNDGRRKNEDKDGQTDGAQPPYATVSDASILTATKERPCDSPASADVPDEHTRGRSPPPQVDDEQGASSPAEAAQVQLPPLWVTPLDDDELRFAPFYDEDFSKPTGESAADINARDQIRRCELLFGRPLTEEERETIRLQYAAMGQRHAPNEQSKRSVILPAPANEAAAVLDTTDAVCDALRIRIAELDSEIDGLGSRQEALEDTNVSNLMRLDGAKADIEQLKRQKRDHEARIASLASELQAVKADLRVLEARIQTPIEESDPETAAAHNEPARDNNQQQDERPHQPEQQPRQAGGFINVWLFVLAAFVLHWVVTTAVLHSARLTDGYGPFINGGYNGLASVLIFGSWFQVLAFCLAMGHFYHVALSVLLPRR